MSLGDSPVSDSHRITCIRPLCRFWRFKPGSLSLLGTNFHSLSPLPSPSEPLKKIFKIIFNHTCRCVSVSAYAHECRAQGGQKRVLCSLDLELQVVVSEQVQVLGTKLRFSTQPLCLAPVTQRVVSLCQQVCRDLLLCALGSISHPVDIHTTELLPLHRPSLDATSL